MKVFSVSNYNCKPTFGVNLQSKKLRFKEDDFYVRIKGYGHHSGWAKKIKETADKAVEFIRQTCNAEETLKRITIGVTDANQLPLDLDKRQHTGILRIERNGWRHISSWNDSFGIITRYSSSGKNKYKIYADRLDYTVQHPLKNPFSDIGLTIPRHDKNFYGKYLDHADSKYINNALRHVKDLYNQLHINYIQNELKEKDLDNVNSLIAEVRWILAHATPWERGSDAISNTFIRAIYKAMGVKVYPLKKDVSLDLEAYCTNLDEYKKNFTSYFSKKPEIIY